MSSQDQQPHFLLFPLMAQGHMIPMMDIGRLLAQRGVIVSIVTTPFNADRFATVTARAKESGLPIQVFEFQFPSQKTSSIPEGCESADMLPSLDQLTNLLTAASQLQQPVDNFFQQLKPRPICIISDVCLPWTSNIAKKYQIPRISFSGTSCFCLTCGYKAFGSKVLESVTSETEYFVVPGLPDDIEWTKAQLPRSMLTNSEGLSDRLLEAETESYGIIMNTFEDLEEEFVGEYKKTVGKNVWCVGPVSLTNKNALDKAERGNKASLDEYKCLEWLDTKEPGSVVYVCFGSICNLIPAQLIELGLGLEGSNRAFIWALRRGEQSKELKKWSLESGFEERIKGRGFVIWGWAPQVLILSHPAIGGFFTHCGWNSILEGICAGMPMLTWPLFADQFSNEKLVVNVLKIGVKVGAEVPVMWGQEEKIGVQVKKEDITMAVDRLMKGGDDKEDRRKRAKQLAEMAKRATEDGGSSYVNLGLLIQDVIERARFQAKPM